MGNRGQQTNPEGTLRFQFIGNPQDPTTVPKSWATEVGQLLDRARINRGSIDTQDPKRGLNIKIPDMIPQGGPFYPSVYVPSTAEVSQTNDQIVIGENGVKRLPGDVYYYKPGRSATTPGILMVSEAQKSLTAEETVAVFQVAETRLLTLKTVVSGSTITVSYPFYTLAQLTDGTTLKDWKDVSGNVHFPLGWVTMAQEDRAGTTKWRVQQITWPNTSWLLQGGTAAAAAVATVCVQITSSVDYQHYKCTVYGNGYRDDTGAFQAATATDQDLWIDQIASGNIIPTNTRLRATKIGTHYEAEVPRWL